MERLLGTVIILVALLTIGGGIALKDSIETYWRANDIAAIASDQEASGFEAKIAEYAEQKWGSDTTRSQSTKAVIEKLVIVNATSRKKDELNSLLPEDMRANNEQEVDAIVLVRRGEEVSGGYYDRSGTVRKTTSISVFIPNGQILCASKVFKESESPQSRNGRDSTIGDSRLSEAVLSHIKSCIRNAK